MLEVASAFVFLKTAFTDLFYTNGDLELFLVPYLSITNLGLTRFLERFLTYDESLSSILILEKACRMTYSRPYLSLQVIH